MRMKRKNYADKWIPFESNLMGIRIAQWVVAEFGAPILRFDSPQE